MNLIELRLSILLGVLVMATGACSSSGQSDEADSVNQAPNIIQDDESDVPSGAENQVTYAGQSRPVTQGIVDIIGENRGHYEVDFQFSDGTFRIAFYELQGFLYDYWYAEKDTALFSTDLYSASKTRLDSGTYNYVDISDIRKGTSTLGRSVFSQSVVGIDHNNDGEVDSDEQLDVVDGTLVLSGNSLTDMSISFDVLLTDGSRSSGHYRNGFRLVE